MFPITTPICNLYWVDTFRKLNPFPKDLTIKSAEYIEDTEKQNICNVVVKDIKGNYKNSPLLNADILIVVEMGDNNGTRRVIRGVSTQPSYNFGEYPEYTFHLHEIDSEIMSRQTYILNYPEILDSEIVKKIIVDGRYHLEYDIDETRLNIPRLQHAETDYAFIQRLANEQSPKYIFKVENSVLSFINPKRFLQRKPYLLEWRTGRRSLKSFTFNVNIKASNGMILSSFIDPATGKRTVYEVKMSEISKTGETTVSNSGGNAVTKKYYEFNFLKFISSALGQSSSLPHPGLDYRTGMPFKDTTVVKTPAKNKDHNKQNTDNAKEKDDENAITADGSLTNGNIFIRIGDRCVIDGCGENMKNFCFVFDKITQRIDETKGLSTSFSLKFFNIDSGIYAEAKKLLEEEEANLEKKRVINFKRQYDEYFKEDLRKKENISEFLKKDKEERKIYGNIGNYKDKEMSNIPIYRNRRDNEILRFRPDAEKDPALILKNSASYWYNPALSGILTKGN